MLPLVAPHDLTAGWSVLGRPPDRPLTNRVANAMLLGITLLAAGFPAYHAACMQPVEATRESD